MGKFFENIELDNVKVKNKNKFYEEKVCLESNYYNLDDKKMAIMSDIHYHPHVDKDLYRLLIEYVRRTKPDYIIMPGDQIETNNFIDNYEEKMFFEDFMRALAEVCPVIIIPGNHEIHNLEVKTFFNKNSSKESIKSMKFFDSLSRIRKIYFLNNEQMNLNGINFLGFTPSIETYFKKNQKIIDMFMDEFVKVGFKVNKDDYNVLLTHNSLPLTKNDTYQQIDDFNYTDLVISGHFHDGYLPKFLDKRVVDCKKGIFFYPWMMPHKGVMCRGIKEFGRGYLFVSQGFRTWNADIALFNLFEKVCANDVEEIILTRKLKR